jgi:hypothetical protein
LFGLRSEYLIPYKKWTNLKNILFEYCNKNKSIPTRTVEYNGRRIGLWLQTQKSKINNENDDIYIKLAANQYIKICLDDYLNPNKKWNESKMLLFEYCNKNKSVPTRKVEYKGQLIGLWLTNQKSKINSENDDVYIKLATNQYVKNSLDDFLKLKDQNKDKVILGWDDSKNLLFEYCNKNKSVPPVKVVYSGRRIGKWLQDQKRKINNKNDNMYIKLATNQYVKDSLDKCLDKRQR